MRGEVDGGLAANMANADGGDKSREWRIFAGLNIIYEFMSRNFSEAIERFDLAGSQSISPRPSILSAGLEA